MNVPIPSTLAALALALVPALALATQDGPIDEVAARRAAKEAIDAGQYERAQSLVAQLLLDQRLGRAEERLRAGEPEAAWKALQAALALAPASERAAALRTELAGILLARQVEEARALLAAGDPRDAMLILDDAVGLAPDDPEVHFLRGECSLRMGVEDGDLFAFEDARASFVRSAGSGRVPEAWSGAGRALFQLYFASSNREELERALDYSRRGRDGTAQDSPRAALMSFPPARTFAEVAFQAYAAVKLEGADDELAKARFDEARAAIEALVGRAPEDPFGWRQLANLLRWENRFEEAREVLLRALAISPEESSLHEQLAAIAREIGGADEAVATYRSFVAEQPESALGRWWLGVLALDQTLDALMADERELTARFRAAEAEFARCAELAPDYAESCAGYRAIARAGVAWCHYHQGELEAARAAFVSMEELLEGGLHWQYPGKLPSGVAGLRFVIDGYMQRSADESGSVAERNEALERAAEIAAFLHEYQPDDASVANDAGLLLRDAGVELQQQAEILLRRSLGLTESAGELSAEQRAEARARAEELLARSRRHMEQSYRAYAAAAELEPEDARIVNDTGLILAYYLQRELDVAEAYLRRAIELGEEQLAAGIDDPNQREVVTEAVGDAHQNLGVIALTLRGDAAAAMPLFERSVEIGPFPRPQVVHRYLPLCAKILAGELEAELVKRANYWNELEVEKVVERIRAEDELREFLYGKRG